MRDGCSTEENGPVGSVAKRNLYREVWGKTAKGLYYDNKPTDIESKCSIITETR